MASSTVIIAPAIKLNDGQLMPSIGLGTFQGNYDFTTMHATVVEATKSAIDIGYRHIDSAAVYNTESGIGEAIRDKIKEGVVTREELFVTTKLWNNSHHRDLVVPALRKSLETLGLDYVNMFLMHWPFAFKSGDEMWPKDEHGQNAFEEETHFTETWEGMIECQQLGLTRSIGVSNFNERQLKRLLDTGTVRPANCQFEVNVFFANESLVNYCQAEHIQVTAYSPLHKPYRTWAKPDDPFIATDKTLAALATKYNKSPAQVALRFLIQRGLVVLPKSNSPEHQRENISIFDFELAEDDFQSIKDNCNRNLRVLHLKELFGGASEYPFDDVKTEGH